MDKDNKNIIIISILLVFLIAFLSGLYYLPKFKENPTFSYVEDPLEKNSDFMLKPGNSYTYAYTFKDSHTGNLSITYDIIKNFNCISIRVQQFNFISDCIGKTGIDKNGSNVSLNPVIDMYMPWMLAVHNNWSWKAKLVNSMFGKNEIGIYSIKTIGNETFKGREVYKVEILKDNLKSYVLIDKDKRIMVREEADAYTAELISLID